MNTTDKQRVAVALSGGVDSSAAAALLRERGHEVFGLTMLLGPWGEGTVRDATRVAEKLGVEHHVLDLSGRFEDCVMRPFAEAYAAGLTPNPCAVCNRVIKFGALMEAAKEHGAEALATGHYARLIRGAGGVELHAAADKARDQSYFLFGASKEQLSFLRFPLGEMESKAKVREIAARLGLPVAEKPDSQDICFVPGGDYAGVVKRFHPEAFEAGEIVDMQARVLGRHEGIIHFTPGQRRGLNINDRVGENNEPLFVVRIDAAARRVVVGPREALTQREVMLRDVNWIGGDVLGEGIEVAAKLRSAMVPVAARYFMDWRGGGRIVLRDPVYGVAPGQAGVVYEGTRVMGGGWIAA